MRQMPEHVYSLMRRGGLDQERFLPSFSVDFFPWGIKTVWEKSHTTQEIEYSLPKGFRSIYIHLKSVSVSFCSMGPVCSFCRLGERRKPNSPGKWNCWVSCPPRALSPGLPHLGEGESRIRKSEGGSVWDSWADPSVAVRSEQRTERPLTLPSWSWCSG